MKSRETTGPLLEGNAKMEQKTKPHRANDGRYDYLKHISRNPKRATVEDANTTYVVKYPSTRRAEQ